MSPIYLGNVFKKKKLTEKKVTHTPFFTIKNVISLPTNFFFVPNNYIKERERDEMKGCSLMKRFFNSKIDLPITCLRCH